MNYHSSVGASAARTCSWWSERTQPVPQNADEINLARLVSLLRRRGLWIVLCFVLAVAAAVAYSKHEPQKYTATASLSFTSNSLSQELAGFPTSIGSSAQQQATNLELLHLGNLTAKTAASVGHGQSAETVGEAIAIEGQPESSVATVSATSTSPRLAAELANTYAEEFVHEQGEIARKYYASARALVRQQLDALSPAQRLGSDGLELEARAQSLQFLAGLQKSGVQVAQAAAVPTAPSSPRTKRNALIGGILGLFVGVALILLLERLDPRVRGPEQLASLYDAPLLGVVPWSSALSLAPGGGIASANASEVFNMLWARLRAHRGGRDLRVVLITSASSGDGKTTVARNLAEAGARMGSEVLLVEADLCRPALSSALGTQAKTSIVDVLEGAAELDVAAQTVEATSEATRRTAHGSVTMLPAGRATPANRVALIEGQAMDQLLERARSAYDLVVVDAPDLSSVSDAFLLLPKVDAVVVVGRIGLSRRDVVQRVKQALDLSGFAVAGVVADGVKSTKGAKSKIPVSEHAGAATERAGVLDSAPGERGATEPVSAAEV
jgi:succinoglycan biosynthesis transport protein ExoP